MSNSQVRYQLAKSGPTDPEAAGMSHDHHHYHGGHSIPNAGPSHASTDSGGDQLNNSLSKRDAIQASFIDRKLNDHIQTEMLIRDLLLYIPFLIMFLFFFIFGRHASDAFYMDESVRNLVVGNEIPDITVNRHFGDIINMDDWYEWVNGTVFQNVWANNQDPATNVYGQGQNQLLGVMQLRALHVTNNSCPSGMNKYMFNNSNFPPEMRKCYWKWGSKYEEKATFYNGPDLMSFTWTDPKSIKGDPTVGILSSYHWGGYIVPINFSDGLQAAYDKLTLMKASNFIDNQRTRFVIVEYFTYIPQYDAFVSAKMYNEITAGGTWVPSDEFRTFSLWTEREMGQIIYNFCFFAFIVFMFFRWCQGLFEAHRDPLDSVFGYVTRFWNILEIVNLGAFFITFAFHWVWWQKCKNVKLSEFPFHNRFPAELQEVMFYYLGQSYWNALNTVLTFVKAMKFAALSPRLNFILRVIKRCEQNIYGVLLIFVWVLFAYAITAYGIFGNGLREYLDLDTSYAALARLLIGDFDYEELRRENRWLAPVFFWSFVVLGLFLLLNFIIGILSDGFETEKANLTLDEEAELTDGLKALWNFFKWRNIKRRLGLATRCRSEIALLKQVIGIVRERAEQAEEQIRQENAAAHPNRKPSVASAMSTDTDDANRVMDRAMLMGAVSRTEFVEFPPIQQFPPDFRRELWEDLLKKWRTYLAKDVTREKLENREILQEGAKLATEAAFSKLQVLRGTIELMEMQMNKARQSIING